jgi:hypothetical protein
MKKDLLPEIDRFRKELKAHIAKKGLDDGEYAHQAQVKANTLSLFLTGVTKVPRMDFFLALIQNTDFRPSLLSNARAPKGDSAAEYKEGMPREIRDAVQKAVQMVEDFIAVVPKDKRLEDRAKKGLFVMLLADHLVAGRQDEIPGLMERILKDFSIPQGSK